MAEKILRICITRVDDDDSRIMQGSAHRAPCKQQKDEHKPDGCRHLVQGEQQPALSIKHETPTEREGNHKCVTAESSKDSFHQSIVKIEPTADANGNTKDNVVNESKHCVNGDVEPVQTVTWIPPVACQHNEVNSEECEKTKATSVAQTGTQDAQQLSAYPVEIDPASEEGLIISSYCSLAQSNASRVEGSVTDGNQKDGNQKDGNQMENTAVNDACVDKSLETEVMDHDNREETAGQRHCQYTDFQNKKLCELFGTGIAGSRTDRHGLIEQTARTTGLTVGQVKSFLYNRKRKTTTVYKPYTKGRSAYNQFVIEHDMDWSAAGASWNALTDGEKAEFKTRAAAVNSKKRSVANMSADEKRQEARGVFRKMSQMVTRLDELGYKYMLMVGDEKDRWKEASRSLGKEWADDTLSCFIREIDTAKKTLDSAENAWPLTHSEARGELVKAVQEHLNRKYEEATGKKKVPYTAIMNGTSEYVPAMWPLSRFGFKTPGSYGAENLRELLKSDVSFERRAAAEFREEGRESSIPMEVDSEVVMRTASTTETSSATMLAATTETPSISAASSASKTLATMLAATTKTPSISAASSASKTSATMLAATTETPSISAASSASKTSATMLAATTRTSSISAASSAGKTSAAAARTPRVTRASEAKRSQQNGWGLKKQSMKKQSLKKQSLNK